MSLFCHRYFSTVYGNPTSLVYTMCDKLKVITLRNCYILETPEGRVDNLEYSQCVVFDF